MCILTYHTLFIIVVLIVLVIEITCYIPRKALMNLQLAVLNYIAYQQDCKMVCLYM